MEHLAPPRVQQFLDYLQYERHFSAYTSRCYGADLRQFGQFLLGVPAEIIEDLPEDLADAAEAHGHLPGANGHAVNGHAAPGGAAGNGVALAEPPVFDASMEHVEKLLLNANAEDVRNYLQFMRENNYSRATMARKLATLRSFFKFLNKRGMTSNNPMLTIRTPKQEKRLPKFMTEEQISLLLHTPDDAELLGARDKAMLEAMYSTGMRVSELVGLNTEDLDFTAGVIRVRGKGRKERMTPIGQSALGAIEKYIAMRKGAFPQQEPAMPLFINKHGRRLSTRSVRRGCAAAG